MQGQKLRFVSNSPQQISIYTTPLFSSGANGPMAMGLTNKAFLAHLRAQDELLRWVTEALLMSTHKYVFVEK